VLEAPNVEPKPEGHNEKLHAALEAYQKQEQEVANRKLEEEVMQARADKLFLRGVEYMQDGALEEAIVKFSEALKGVALCPNPSSDFIIEALTARAFCNLELLLFVDTIMDTSAALALIFPFIGGNNIAMKLKPKHITDELLDPLREIFKYRSRALMEIGDARMAQYDLVMLTSSELDVQEMKSMLEDCIMLVEEEKSLPKLEMECFGLDLYAILNLDRTLQGDALLTAVRENYRELARRIHPNSLCPVYEKVGSTVFNYVQSAYDVLVDEDLRAAYHQASGVVPQEAPASGILSSLGLW
jgi:hypothetical protein